MGSKSDAKKKRTGGVKPPARREFLDMSFLFQSSGQGKPEFLQFPPGGRFAVCVQRELDGDGWLVLTHLGYGRVHGDFNAALHDAAVVAAGCGVTVRSSAGRIPC